MNWKLYEEEVFKTLKLFYPDAKIEKNLKKKGLYSKKERQVDIYIEDIVGGSTIKIYVECKFYNKPIDVKTVESFISMASDLQADIGLMISEKGYTKTAIKRAFYNPENIELDILSLAELKHLQGNLALPYSGENAVLLLSPFGWVIDATKRSGFICTLYQRGLTFEEAMQKGEIAYINYWDRNKNGEDLNELIRIQEKGMRDNAYQLDIKVNEIKYLENNCRKDAKTIIRFADIEKYPGIELTGFVEFKDFIFFCVWFSDPLKIKRNISKIWTMLKMALPIKVENNCG